VLGVVDLARPQQLVEIAAIAVLAQPAKRKASSARSQGKLR
jgi:hypothetical protein